MNANVNALSLLDPISKILSDLAARGEKIADSDAAAVPQQVNIFDQGAAQLGPLLAGSDMSSLHGSASICLPDDPLDLAPDGSVLGVKVIGAAGHCHPAGLLPSAGGSCAATPGWGRGGVHRRRECGDVPRRLRRLGRLRPGALPLRRPRRHRSTGGHRTILELADAGSLGAGFR